MKSTLLDARACGARDQRRPPSSRAAAAAAPSPRSVRAHTTDPTTALSGIAYLMQPEGATIFSALIAATSVGVSLLGSLLTEKRKAELQKEFERERAVLERQNELRSVLARFRGPLLEAAVDFEQRVYHLLVLDTNLSLGCQEEVVYTLFTVAQFLGFVEVVRREGPREHTFLHPGNSQGSDTLAALVEAFRFVMCAHAQQLQEWHDSSSDEDREHPGSRSRRPAMPATAASADLDQAGLGYSSYSPGAGSSGGCSDPLNEAVRAAEASVWGQQRSTDWESASRTGRTGRTGSTGSTGRRTHLEGSEDQGFQSRSDSGRAVWRGGSNGGHMHSRSIRSSSSSSSMRGVGDGASRLGVMEDEELVGFSNAVDFGGEGVPKLRDGCPLENAFRLSRGMQRAIGSLVNVTPLGARRQYTMCYSEFYSRFRTEPYFAGWFKPLYHDIQELLASRQKWRGQAPFPFNRWTRLLLLQQLLTDAIDLLDPLNIRVPANKRVRLSPLTYGPLPNVNEYLHRITVLESLVEAQGAGPPQGGAGSATSTTDAEETAPGRSFGSMADFWKRDGW